MKGENGRNKRLVRFSFPITGVIMFNVCMYVIRNFENMWVEITYLLLVKQNENNLIRLVDERFKLLLESTRFSILVFL